MNISILGLRSPLKICLILSSSAGVFIPPPPTRISRDAISHFLVDGFQWKLALIFIMWLGTAGKLFKVRSQMWTKMFVFHWRRHTSRSVASGITFYLSLRPSCPRTRRVHITPDFINTIQYNTIQYNRDYCYSSRLPTIRTRSHARVTYSAPTVIGDTT